MAWAAVALLDEVDAEFLPDCLLRMRELLEHLRRAPDPGRVRKEYSDLLKSWLGEADLLEGLLAWVDEGLPTGSAFRRSKAARLVRGLSRPPPFVVAMEGGFGMPYQEGQEKYRILADPKVEWRLPFRTDMTLWVGVRGVRGGAARGDPAARNRGKMGTHPKLRFRAGPKGEKSWPIGVNVRHFPEADRFGVMLLEAQSPNGLVYLFLNEWALK
jgi:hypothetical protein